jgi:hypothetical protein
MAHNEGTEMKTKAAYMVRFSEFGNGVGMRFAGSNLRTRKAAMRGAKILKSKGYSDVYVASMTVNKDCTLRN